MRGEANDHTTEQNSFSVAVFCFLRSATEWVSRSVWTFCATVGDLGWVGPMQMGLKADQQPLMTLSLSTWLGRGEVICVDKRKQDRKFLDLLVSPPKI